MIGPEAFDNLFVAKPHPPKHEGYVICHGSKEYTYYLHIPEMFDDLSAWMDWCEEDVANNNGEYADNVEAVE